MQGRKKCRGWNRRQFVAGMTAVGFTTAQGQLASAVGERDVYIIPNFHPASCGWLTTFSKERIYCANSYLNHLDRVRDDAQYEFVMSEVNNLVAIMSFKGERIPELKQRIREKRVELVNGFFLESTVNLSGGEALVRLGAEGLRWYTEVFGIRPRFAWCIDTCGVHDQMAQIVKGLGLEALIYTRNNPVGKTLYWTVSPDGSRVLTLCPGSYHEARSIFDSKMPLSPPDLHTLEQEFAAKEQITPAGASLLVLGGGADYSLAPKVTEYPTGLLSERSKAGYKRKVRFATLSKYVDSITPEIQSGAIALATQQGGTAYDYDSFWIECPKVKTWFRKNEQGLQVAESLATIASLAGRYKYPSQALYDAWVLMFLSMDRNTLWGSAGGMVFESTSSWDVRDRLSWVSAKTSEIQQSAGSAAEAAEDEVALFNALNWQRKDPIALKLPDGVRPEYVPCQAMSDGTTLCQLALGGTAVKKLRLSRGAASQPVGAKPSRIVETAHYRLQFHPTTGDIESLRSKANGTELFRGAANVVIAERPKVRKGDPGDLMPPSSERERLGSSSGTASEVEVSTGPLAIEILATGQFHGGGTLKRTIRLYQQHARIDFETELNDIPDDTVVFVAFPFAKPIEEVRRGVPFGFSHAAWSKPNPELTGWGRGIVPAVRWTDYSFAGGGGASLLDRGLTGRELNGSTASLYLLNAQDKYHGYSNSWLSGKGKHVLQYALLPRHKSWHEARVVHAALEYNLGPVVLRGGTTLSERPYVRTSTNVIVESLRRKEDTIVLRLVEAYGRAGEAEVWLALPHNSAALADLTGRTQAPLAGKGHYRFPLRAQQIATLVFRTEGAVQKEEPVTGWDKFVLKEKRPALQTYDPSLIGHPPFGD